MIEIKNLKKSFGDLKVLKGIDQTINDKEVLCVIGPSGGGKSTFLRCLNRLEEPDSGEIRLDGELITDANITETREKMGMVFQNFNLFKNMTVLGNITAAPIHVKNMPKEQAEKKAMDLLKLVGLADKANDRPDSLSGGQQQRVAIARALAIDPEIMPFDEPTSALDPEMVGEVIDIMEELSAEHRSMIVVTHEMGFAKAAADRISFLEGGRFLETNTPIEFFEHPKNESLAKFISQIQ